MDLGRVGCVRMQEVVKPDRVGNPAGPAGGPSARSNRGLAKEKLPGPPRGDRFC